MKDGCQTLDHRQHRAWALREAKQMKSCLWWSQFTARREFPGHSKEQGTKQSRAVSIEWRRQWVRIWGGLGGVEMERVGGVKSEETAEQLENSRDWKGFLLSLQLRTNTITACMWGNLQRPEKEPQARSRWTNLQSLCSTENSFGPHQQSREILEINRT